VIHFVSHGRFLNGPKQPIVPSFTQNHAALFTWLVWLLLYLLLRLEQVIPHTIITSMASWQNLRDWINCNIPPQTQNVSLKVDNYNYGENGVRVQNMPVIEGTVLAIISFLSHTFKKT
jgi:hypothetical protein